jgi:hypothetical protein
MSNKKKEIPQFWKIQYGKNGAFFSLIQLKLNEMLLENGFCRYAVSRNNYIFLQQNGKVVNEIDSVTIADFVEDTIQNIPENHEGLKFDDDFLPVADLHEKFLKGLNSHLSVNMLYRLKPKEPILFNEHLEHEAFFYYKNGFVKITPKGVEFNDYSKLKKNIFQSQILQRDFKLVKEYDTDENGNYMNDFYNFILNICGYRTEGVRGNYKNRVKSLSSIIGYLLHGYQDGKKKAVIITDSAISAKDEPNGRTGKSLLSKMLGWMLNASDDVDFSGVYTEINGKTFKPDNKHRYERCQINTSLISINDVDEHSFNFSQLFNDVTESIVVDRKGLKPFNIQSKLLLTTNRTVRIEGESGRDRVIEFELSDYYNAKRSPLSETGKWFGRDWSQDEWNIFDNFMCEAVKFYMSNGLVEAEGININIRKLIEETAPEFYDFALDVKADKPEPNILPNQSYNKQELYDSFLGQYPDFANVKWFSQRTFTKWCSLLSSLYYRGTFEERTTDQNAVRWFRIFVENEDTKTPF